jgi:hypothetical protein
MIIDNNDDIENNNYAIISDFTYDNIIHSDDDDDDEDDEDGEVFNTSFVENSLASDFQFSKSLNDIHLTGGPMRPNSLALYLDDNFTCKNILPNVSNQVDCQKVQRAKCYECRYRASRFANLSFIKL